MTPLPRFWGPCSSLTALPVFFYTWNFVDKQGRNCVICRGGDDRFKIVYLIKRPLVPKLTFFYLIKSLYFEQLGENSLNFTVCLLFSFFFCFSLYISTHRGIMLFLAEKEQLFISQVYSVRNYKYVVASHGFSDSRELSRVWNQQREAGNA